jgi:hypothetical protein
VPEARGSSARVYLGKFPVQKGRPNYAAIKLMRMEYLDYALPFFHEEALVLTQWRTCPGVTPLVECGFIKFDDGAVLPSDREHSSAEAMTGTILRLGTDEVESFLGLLEAKAAGWLGAVPGHREAGTGQQPAALLRCRHDPRPFLAADRFAAHVGSNLRYH